MKIEVQENFQSSGNRRLSCFVFVEDAHDHGDSLYLGCEDGHVSVYNLPPQGHSMKKTKEEDLGVEGELVNFALHHKANVTVLLHSKHPKLYSPTPYGLLFSGSADRTVRIWSGKSMIQNMTLSATVTGLADGADGSIISICIDGQLKVWAPQRGRSMMLNPYFECTFSLYLLDSRGDGWISAIDIASYGNWGIYVGNSVGSISLYRKTNVDTSDMEDHVASSSSPLARHRQWDNIHALGVSYIRVVPQEGFLLTLSSNGCCKVLDAVMGATIVSFENPRKCAYVGVLMSGFSLYLTDELGNFQVHDVGKGSSPAVAVIKQATAKQQEKILKSHYEPILGAVCAYRAPGWFFTALMPLSSRAAAATMDTQPSELSAKVSAQSCAQTGCVSLIKASRDLKEREYYGHENMIIAVCINDVESGNNDNDEPIAADKNPSHVSSHNARRDRSAFLRVSRDESVVISVGSDNTIRCWDDYDATESYQFQSKHRSEITCARILWGFNSLIVGHEDGAIVVWNIDSGKFFIPRSPLTGAVTSFVEAVSPRSHVLVGSDFAGRLGVWNLAQFRKNPSILSLDITFQSHHDPEEPGLLSLAYHAGSETYFTGGVDRVIKVWKVGTEVSGSLRTHMEAVCSLECTDNFLLSGDEGGTVYLWRVVIHQTGTQSFSQYDAIGSHLPTLIPMCCFFSAFESPARSILALKEQSETSTVFVVQAGRGDQTVVWEVSFDGRGKDTEVVGVEVGVEITDTSLQSTANVDDGSDGDSKASEKASLVSGTPTPAARAKRHSILVTTSSAGGLEEMPRLSQEEYRLLDRNVSCKVKVSKLAEISHTLGSEEYEASCVQLSCSGSGRPQYVYIGTIDGVLRRIEL